MKLLQLNIWEGRLIRQIIPFIEEQKPDIICLQEVFSCKETIEVPTRQLNSFEEILKATGYEHSYFSTNIKMQVDLEDVLYGNAIISKFPLAETKTINIHDAITIEHNDQSHTGTLQMAKVMVGSNQSITVLNHHGHWEPNHLGNDISTACLQKVCDIAVEYKVPLIICGDLNVSNDSPAMRVFDGKFQNLTVTHNVKSTLNQFGKVDNVACDHILISKDILELNFSVSDKLVSDHKSLILEFAI